MATAEELKSRDLAEASREKVWNGDSFIKELFLGRFRPDLMDPFPVGEPTRPEFLEWFETLKTFLKEKVDPVEIDRTGEYPEEVVQGLRELGAFGIKIPKEYGGLGLTHPEYTRVMQFLGAYDCNVTALLSAHQAIGVPQPVKLFGSDALKKEYLPRCAKGAISAFALTEPAVGSDPARLETVAELTDDGENWILNGTKLWCTNGTLAELLVVMARNPKTDRINAYVVETAWEGVKIEHRCRFMGLKALGNAVVSFTNVKVPKGNLIGEDGEGLKIALVTLNTGRLTLPAGTSGGAKLLLETCRKWCAARVQWGVPVGKHEAIAHKLADMTTVSFALESTMMLLGELADRKGVDIRLEAAAAKEWNTTRAWRTVDEALQIRGGRGYETELSLKNRGEAPLNIERMMRDTRINLIFEGSSEIMHLFMAREAVDKHLQVAGALVDPRSSFGAKVKAALFSAAPFYAWWYPTRWIGFTLPPKYGSFGKLARYMRFAERASRKLSRSVFHGMMVYQAKLEYKQKFLFRAVDIAMELFVLTSVLTRAKTMRLAGDPNAKSAERIADLFARGARRNIKQWFKDMWRNDDALKHAVGKELLNGDYTWLETGTAGVPFSIEELTPPKVSELIAMRGSGDAAATPAAEAKPADAPTEEEGAAVG